MESLLLSTKKLLWKFKSYVKNIHNLFWNLNESLLLLPELVRYKLLYNQWTINKEEVLMLLDPKYDAIPMYLTAKFLSWEDKINYIKEAIKYSWEGWYNIKDISIWFLNDSIIVDIDAHKLQYLSLIGFETTSLFIKKINEIDPNHNLIPVILLNWGLLWIKAISKFYTKVLFWDDTERRWWMYYNDWEDSIIKEFSDFGKNDYMIVDDTIQTWYTYEQLNKKITQDNGNCVQCIPFTIPNIE